VAPGVLTPGRVDWRGHAGRILPADLNGLRTLDVGTFDGFWAFEMERRGAAVVAIDVDSVDAVDLPPPQRARQEAGARAMGFELGGGFRIAHGLLGSSVERVVADVRELEPDTIGGQVDLVFIGALLEHVRDPVGVLERLRGVLRPGGRLIVLEGVSLWATVVAPRSAMAAFQPLVSNFTWWRANAAGLLAYIETAGFEDVRRRGRLMRPPAHRGMRGVYCHAEARVAGG
jgi:SAM-dependent methyltransferase